MNTINFLLSGFHRAFIPPIIDEPDTCEILEEALQVSATNITPIDIIAVTVESLILVVFLTGLWIVAIKNNRKKKQMD